MEMKTTLCIRSPLHVVQGQELMFIIYINYFIGQILHLQSKEI